MFILTTKHLKKAIVSSKYTIMANSYYDATDLSKFGNITEYQKTMGDKFFGWYGEVFKDSALTAKEKSLIALAVAHAVQCPYCIDAYSSDAYEKGYSQEQMMEAVHVAAAIRGGASLVHGVQMMNKVKEIAM
ncbi:MAG: 4-carboxymuconolactone decarboxylase [Segetibacter sp.]|nr:4-carboxymuconolactone decarboxylase [Segetibacter sp.]